jgi:hypothetical protein
MINIDSFDGFGQNQYPQIVRPIFSSKLIEKMHFSMNNLKVSIPNRARALLPHKGRPPPDKLSQPHPSPATAIPHLSS